jgi:diphthine-ammonia ligase
MKVAVLFSGGKDSTFSIYKAKMQGHEVVCIVTIFPQSEESQLLHYPNIEFTKLQSESMNIPQISIKIDSTNPNSEAQTLQEILVKAKEEFGIQGIVHGGILSEFQRKQFKRISQSLDITLISPIWKQNEKEYMKNLLESKFHFMTISVTSDGLDESWLGKEITKDDLSTLNQLAEKYGFNLSFEGGEAETFVTDCPLFSYPIKILKSKKTWDGYRGRFEILEAKLDNHAR